MRKKTKDVAKNHPTGLSLLAVTLIVAIGPKLGLDIDEDTAFELVVAVGLVVSALTPRFKKRRGGTVDSASPVVNCIDSKLRD